MSYHAGELIDAAVRALVLFAFLPALLILLTHWAVRSKAIAPSGWWPRFVRKWGDPLLRPVERRLHSAGANPQDAPLWLLGVVLVAGLLAISATRWLLGSVALLGSLQNASPRTWLRLGLASALSLVSLAIIVRVIGSWLGVGRYTRWMRPVYLFTDWIVEPIRRRLPPFGPLDLSPLLAYLIILLLRSLLLSVL
ncbi:MAG TPA: YggT family protein [Gemmatimonadales bacterium]|jgi:YggT family protein|nr:YggT family protein [Gemmatimonadales bacterium]